MARAEKRYADDPAYQITLNDEQLRNLGKLHVVWSQLDWQVITAISAILKIPMAATIALLDNVTSGTLVNYLKKQAVAVEDRPLRQEINEFHKRMGELIGKRNHLAHGTWGWELASDEKRVRPACCYQKSDAPIYADDLPGLCRLVMAESHAIDAIKRKLIGLPPNPEQLTSPYFFGDLGLGDGPPKEDWYVKSFLQPGMDHHKPD